MITENKELQRLSASKLKTYKTCARQYYFKYINPPEFIATEERNIGALLGSALHRAIELYYKEGKNPIVTFQDRLLNIHTEWEEQGYIIKGEQWISKIMKDGKKILKEFPWTHFQPIELEYHFDLPFPDKYSPIAIMTGYIDLIDKQGFVVDHKSQRKLPVQDQLENDAQLIIYYWAYNEIYNNPPRVYWNHLRTNEIIHVAVETNYNDKLQQLTEDIKAMLNHGSHYARINLSDTCKRECSFYKQCFGA